VSAEDEQTPAGADDAEYSETLRTPWWWYPVALGVATVLAAEFHVAAYSLTDWVPFGILLPFAVAVVWWSGRSKLVVSKTELSIRGAHIPLSYVSNAIALDARTLRRVIGREGDPLGFVAIRPWIGPGVQLQLDDPEDPTPYWVVSTRRPERVAALIRARSGGDLAR
jgi:hypothetical protein